MFWNHLCSPRLPSTTSTAICKTVIELLTNTRVTTLQCCARHFTFDFTWYHETLYFTDMTTWRRWLRNHYLAFEFGAIYRTGDSLLMITSWDYLWYSFHARATDLATPLTTFMFKFTDNFGTWLLAGKFLLMFEIYRMTHPVTSMTTSHLHPAWFCAASLWCVFKILSF